MPPIQRPDISNELRRQFGIVGFGGPESLSPEIVPVVIVQDISPSKTFRSAAGGALSPAVAAEFSEIQLFNPDNSRTILEAYQVVYDPSAISIIGLREADTAITDAAASERFLDRRLTGRPVGQVRTDSAAVLVGVGHGHWQAARDPGQFIMPVEYTLVPGTGVVLISETANVSVRGSWWWRERAELQTD